jgi:hypothetical protein
MAGTSCLRDLGGGPPIPAPDWRRLPWGALARAGLGIVLLGSLGRPSPAHAAGARSDTTHLRVELGVSSDLTNEIFYEDEFVDTLFLGRRLVSDPEHRVAAVLQLALDGTRAAGSTRYALRNETSWGDLLQRNALGLSWRTEVSPEWRLSLAPRAEFRRDRTFDRDLTEWRADVLLKARRSLLDGVHALEWAARGELVRTEGTGSEFLLDRHGVRLSAALERIEWMGQEIRLGYGMWARAFPDSTSRDHFQHTGEFSWRRDMTSGALVAFESDVSRRVTFDVVETTRDNFWEGRGAFEGWLPVASGWTLRARLEGEAQRFDVPDSVLYFDYQLMRMRLAPRWEPRPGLSIAAGPRAEMLWSAWNAAERYVEWAGAFELEWLGGRAWWSVAPSVGWREYAESVSNGLALHSPYAFYDITVVGDQPFAGPLRLRAFVNARLESHTDSAQDARSLYFSLDVRTLF